MFWVMERWGSMLSVESWQLCWQFPVSGKSECCWGGHGHCWVTDLGSAGSWLEQHHSGNHEFLVEVWTAQYLRYHPRVSLQVSLTFAGMQGKFIFMGSRGIGKLVWGISQYLWWHSQAGHAHSRAVEVGEGWAEQVGHAGMWGMGSAGGWQESSSGAHSQGESTLRVSPSPPSGGSKQPLRAAGGTEAGGSLTHPRQEGIPHLLYCSSESLPDFVF